MTTSDMTSPSAMAERLREFANNPVFAFFNERRHDLLSLLDDHRRLREALKTIRGLVNEGGVPRYTVTPGAALNAVIEEVVDPALRLSEGGEG